MATAIYDFFRALTFVPFADDIADFDNETLEADDEIVSMYLPPFRRANTSTPRRLAGTPTEAHLPPRARVSSSKKRSVQRNCPHCNGKVNVNFKTNRVTQPTPKRKTKTKRYVLVRDDLLEDLSPTTRVRPGKGPKVMKSY